MKFTLVCGVVLVLFAELHFILLPEAICGHTLRYDEIKCFIITGTKGLLWENLLGMLHGFVCA